MELALTLGVPVALSESDEEETEFEEGALDPGELDGDFADWDEGADDELG